MRSSASLDWQSSREAFGVVLGHYLGLREQREQTETCSCGAAVIHFPFKTKCQGWGWFSGPVQLLYRQDDSRRVFVEGKDPADG